MRAASWAKDDVPTEEEHEGAAKGLHAQELTAELAGIRRRRLNGGTSCGPSTPLSECFACSSRPFPSSSSSFLASARSRRLSARPRRRRGTDLPPIASPASIACCSSTSTRTASPAPSRSCCATAGRSTNGPSAGATRKPDAAWRRHDLPHRVADKALTSVAILSLIEEGTLALTTPVSRVHSGVREDDRGRARRRPAMATVPARRADHDPRSADAHRRHLVRHGAARSRRSTKRRASGRPPGSAGTPPTRTKPICDTMERLGDAAVRRAAGRGVGLRLQHRHPRLRRRASVGHAARRVHRATRITGAARHEGHAVLPAAGAARPTRGRVLERPGRHDRARAGRRPRAGRVRRRSAPELRRRRRPALDRARLRALPRDDPQRRRARRRPHPRRRARSS